MSMRSAWQLWQGRFLKADKSNRTARMDAHEYAFFREIKEAEHNWRVAEMRFNVAVEKDQIDYAIYTLEAAEKRYEMLIRQAKQKKLKIGYVDWMEWIEQQSGKGGGG